MLSLYNTISQSKWILSIIHHRKLTQYKISEILKVSWV